MRRLYRSRTDRILGGICGGISTYADIDPNIIRILWVALTILSVGVGIIAYLVAWILIPEEPEDQASLRVIA